MAKAKQPEGNNGSTNGHVTTNALINDPIATNRLADAINNATSVRERHFSQFWDRRHKIDEECGYPPLNDPTSDAQLFRDMYEHDAISHRVVTIYPKECWQVPPEIFEDEDTEENTPFEQAVADMCQNLKGESWHKQDDENNPLWEILQRLDENSGIGYFGLLLIGFDDVDKDGNPKDLQDPVDGTTPDGYAQDYTGGTQLDRARKDGDAFEQARAAGAPLGTEAQYQGVQFLPQREVSEKSSTPLNVLYLKVYDHSLVQVVQVESEERNPRYCQPVMYLVTMSDPREQVGALGISTTTRRVHWSRVIHVPSDCVVNNESFALPRMKPVFYRLHDLRKLYGGSAEMYWRGAFPVRSWETHPQLGGDVTIDIPKMQKMTYDINTGLERDAFTAGIHLNNNGPTVADPTPQIKVQLEAICIQIGVPMRKFMGSERGELSSQDDEGDWNGKCKHRQVYRCTPKIIAPLFDRLIMVNALPEPDESYTIRWPDVDATKPQEKAMIAQAITAAMAQYVAGNVEAIITLQDWLTVVVGLSDEQAKSIVENAMAEASDRITDDPADIQKEQLKQKGEQFQMGLEHDASMTDAQLQAKKAEAGKSNRPFEGTQNFDPDEPRDKEGRWTNSGGGDTEGQFTTPVLGGAKESKAHHQMISNIAIGLSKKLNYTGEVVISSDSYRFELEGKQELAAGQYDPKLGKVVVFSRYVKDESDARRIISHEIMHAKYHEVRETYEKERYAVFLLGRKQKEEGVPPKERVAVASTGKPNPSYAKEFPTYVKMWQYMEDPKALSKLKEEDGVTAYSRAYWNDKSPMPSWRKVDETLAEMSHLHEVHGNPQGSKLFREYYDAVKEEHSRITSHHQRPVANIDEYYQPLDSSTPQHVMYLDSDLQPTHRGTGTYAHIQTPDGGSIWLVLEQSEGGEKRT